MGLIAPIPFEPAPPSHYYMVYPDHVEFYDFDVGKAVPKRDHDTFILLHLVPHYLKQLDALVERDPKAANVTIRTFGTASATGKSTRNDALSKARAQAIGDLIKKRLDEQKMRKPLTSKLVIGVAASGEGDKVARGLLDAARKANPKMQFSDRTIEKAQYMYRGAFVSLNVVDSNDVPPPGPDPSQEFQIRQVEQVSFNKSFGPGGVAGVTFDVNISFEIKDQSGQVAAYRYTGIGPSAGVPVFDIIFSVFGKVVDIIAKSLGKNLSEVEQGEKAVLWLLKKAFGDKDPEVLQIARRVLPSRLFDFLEAFWSNSTATAKQISKGPFQPFRNRCLRRRVVNNWDGEMQVTQYGVITNYPEWLLGPAPKIVKDLGNTILNFGGVGVVVPDMRPGYAGHIEEFDSGQALFPGLLQLTSTIGSLRFVQLGEFT